MKKIYNNIILSLLTLLILGGCSDPHQYNKEADKTCEAKLQSSADFNELLLYALKSDASPSTIKNILKKGASPTVTVGKEELPIICFAKSPKAIKILYNAHPENKEKHGPAEIMFNDTRQIPLFHYQSSELCETYLEAVLNNVEYGEYEINLGGESKRFPLTKERVLDHILTQKDSHDRNALFYAKNKEMVDYWLSKGYDLNTSDKNGNNVLSYCIGIDETCNIEFLEYLIVKGADVNFGKKDGRITPLGRALLANRNVDIINFLISRGAKIENIENASNLYYCVQNPKQVEFLKQKGISPNVVTTNGIYISVNDNNYIARTPLARAVGKNFSLETIESLINAGAEPQKAFFTLNNVKFSALNFSVSVLRNQNLTELLLKHGAAESFDINKVLNYLVEKKDTKAVSRLIELGVNPTLCANQDKIFNLFLSKNDIPNLKKMIDGGYDINKKSLKDYTSVSFFENENLADKLRKFNTLIEIGYDVNRRGEDGDYILDDVLNEFSDININNISINAFEKIIKNSSALKDKGYTRNCLKKILGRKNLRTESLDVFLENCPSLDMNILRSSLINIFKFESSIPESTIISLIKHIDDLNDKIENTTMIGYALDYDDVSLDIIKAISEKMYFPTTPTNYKYDNNINPIDIAKKLGRNDIVEFFKQVEENYIGIDKNGIIKYYNLHIGMDRKEGERVNIYFSQYKKNESLNFSCDKNDKIKSIKFDTSLLINKLKGDKKLSAIAKSQFVDFTTSYSYNNINIVDINIYEYKDIKILQNTCDGLFVETNSCISNDISEFLGKPLSKSGSHLYGHISKDPRYNTKIDANELNDILNIKISLNKNVIKKLIEDPEKNWHLVENLR